MANTYLNTDWSADALTKATATSSTVDNVALGGTLAVTGATTLSSTLAVTGATTLSGGLTGNVTGNLAGNVTGSNWTGTLNISGATTVTANLSSMYSNSGGAVSILTWNTSSDDDSDAAVGVVTNSNNADVYCSFIHSIEDDPDERWSLGVDGSSDTFKLSYAATNDTVTPSASASYDLMNITKAGVVTIPGKVVAKTYKPETFFAYNLAASSALSSGTEYYMPVGGNPFDFSTVTLGIEPISSLVQTAMCDFAIERIATNIYYGQANVTSIEIRLKKYDGSGDLDDKAQWGTVGTVATIYNSSTLNADTRVVQTPSDWVIEKNEIWGLTLEYTLSSGTVTNVQMSGGILMLQDWNDIIANT
tara:strand:+ start:368 stop:1453 length:1086 start_codon:yes stop_codon:yes gene_type:complete